MYADSGATTHILNNPGKVSKLKTYKGGDLLYVGNGDSLDITHIGEGDIYTENGKLKLKNVLIVPDIKKNLLSIGQLTQDNACNIIFSTNNFVVKDLQGKVIVKGIKKGGLYALDERKNEVFAAFTNKASNAIWHQRLGHTHSNFLKIL